MWFFSADYLGKDMSYKHRLTFALIFLSLILLIPIVLAIFANPLSPYFQLLIAIITTGIVFTIHINALKKYQQHIDLLAKQTKRLNQDDFLDADDKSLRSLSNNITLLNQSNKNICDQINAISSGNYFSDIAPRPDLYTLGSACAR